MQPTAIKHHLTSLVQARALTRSQAWILDQVLWNFRSFGKDRTEVTIGAIARLTGACRDTVVKAMRKGVELGIITKIRTTVRRAIGAYVRVVNGVNIYVFHDPTAETVLQADPQTTLGQEEDISFPPVPRARCDDGCESGYAAEDVDGRTDAKHPAARAWGHAVKRVGGAVSRRNCENPMELPRVHGAVGQTNQGVTEHRSEVGRGGGDDLLAKRRRDFEIRSLEQRHLRVAAMVALPPGRRRNIP